MDSILKMMHLASVNDTFKVVRFFRNRVLKCRYLDATTNGRVPYVLQKGAKVFRPSLQVDNTEYMCDEGNVACVERTRVAVHMKKMNATIAKLEHTLAQTQAYEEEIKRYYGIGFKDGYVRVKYDQLMYSPTKQERMERLV